MKQISKKDFKAMHGAGELRLICGLAEKTKEQVLEAIMAVRNDIEKYTSPATNYGNIESDKNGAHVCTIYRSDCEDFIFIETVIDASKDKSCSWNDIKTYTTAYMAC